MQGALCARYNALAASWYPSPPGHTNTMADHLAPEPEAEEPKAGLASGSLTSNLDHHMVLQCSVEGEVMAPTVLRGRLRPHLSPQHSPMLPPLLRLLGWALRSGEPLCSLSDAFSINSGTATPGASLQLVGHQYSGAEAPMPGSPYSAVADETGAWSIEVHPGAGVLMPVAGPCTLALTDSSTGTRCAPLLTATVCFVRAAASARAHE